MGIDLSGLKTRFQAIYPGVTPEIYSAPARVTILGEHIIHAGGIVLSAAVPLHTWCVVGDGDGSLSLAHREDNTLVNLSLPLKPEDLEAAPPWAAKASGWMSDLGANPDGGVRAYFESEIPLDRGLSRAETHATALMMALEGFRSVTRVKEQWEPCFLKPFEATHPWHLRRESVLGIRLAKEGELLLVDPGLLRERGFPIANERYRFLLLDSQVPQTRATEAHGERLASCNKALRKIQTRFPKVKRLCDLALEELDVCGDILTDVELKRVRHIITEVARVKQGVLKLKQGDFFSIGRLMLDSHVSLKNDYNVSCFEADLLVGFAKSIPGVLGIKITGLGLGGCLLALVERSLEEKAIEKMQQFYVKETEKELGVTPFEPDGGPRRWEN